MFLEILVPWIFLFSSASATAEQQIYVDRPRGVPLSRKGFYDPSRNFACLDGSGSIPFDWVNDDYCDCSDGTDEPGTAACERGQFHCINLGHSPIDIPSSRVNDQICDCCDGSDEWAGFVSCPNICKELGQQAREDAVLEAQKQKDGYQKKEQMIKEAAKLKEEKQKRLDELKAEKDGLEPTRDELEMKKQDIERRENEAKDKHREAWKASQAERKKLRAEAAFKDLDVNQDQKITTDEMQNRLEFDKDSDGSVSHDEATFYLLGKTESDYKHFMEEMWDGLRHVYRVPGEVTPSPEEEMGTDVPPTTPTPPLPATTPASPREPELDDEFDDGEEEEEEEVKGDEVEDFEADKYMDEGKKTSPMEEDEPMPDYDEETKQLIQEADTVRTEFNDIDRKLKDVDNEIKDMEKFFETDFGEHGEFAALKEHCAELTDSKYTYRLCMFDRVSQREKSGGGDTNLGSWEKWDGPEGNKYSIQKYARGQSCWNGPERSSLVRLTCGLETKLVSASEPSRCEYEFVLETPALCSQTQGHLDDEL